MPVTIEQLGPMHVSPLRALLSKDASNNLYLLGLMEEFGVVCGPDRAPFAFHGRFVDGELTAAVFVGGRGGLIVPSASSVSAIADIARKLVGQVEVRACLGEKPLVDALVQGLGGAVRHNRTQKLFGVSADDLGPFTNPLLRQATAQDVEQLIPMAAGWVREVYSRDPLTEDPQGFQLRVRQRVTSGRTYVLEQDGRLVFKLDIGSRSQFGAELEGLYTVPDQRNRGHATLCLGQISRFLLSSLPRLALRIDEGANAHAGIARKVGYLAGRQQRVCWA